MAHQDPTIIVVLLDWMKAQRDRSRALNRLNECGMLQYGAISWHDLVPLLLGRHPSFPSSKSKMGVFGMDRALVDRVAAVA